MSGTDAIADAAARSLALYHLRGTNWKRYLALRGWVGSPQHPNRWLHPSKPGRLYGWREMQHAEREWSREALVKALLDEGRIVPIGRYRALPTADLKWMAGVRECYTESPCPTE